VLCVAQNPVELQRQVDAAVASGNRALVEPASPETAAFNAVLFSGDRDALLALSERVAAREGPIVPIFVAQSDGSYPLEGLLLEQSISTNTTAAGGNAHLMMIG
jgi:RHH-type proline utilization regulon transcriptional repressor/proline dehydrogenase/delta 1-pyrroline-5-carboxylate dehydrogenase